MSSVMHAMAASDCQQSWDGKQNQMANGCHFYTRRAQARDSLNYTNYTHQPWCTWAWSSSISASVRTLFPWEQRMCGKFRAWNPKTGKCQRAKLQNHVYVIFGGSIFLRHDIWMIFGYVWCLSPALLSKSTNPLPKTRFLLRGAWFALIACCNA